MNTRHNSGGLNPSNPDSLNSENTVNKNTGSRLIWILSFAAVLVAVSFCAGVFIGRADNRAEELSFTVTCEHPAETADRDMAVTKVNINTATAEELTKLAGIGKVLADRIVEYRTAHGNFRYEYEIMNVSGIGEAKYKAIKDYITVK